MPAIERSPRYPSVSLGEAITLAKALYEKNGRTAIPAEVVAKVWGYKSPSGPMRSKLGAVKSYGLLAGSGKVAVTPRLITLLMANRESTEYQEALKEAALDPAIFGELLETHREANDDAIRYHLVQEKHFTKDGAKKLAETFGETMALAGLIQREYPRDQVIQVEPVILHAEVAKASARALPPTISAGSVYRWPLGRDMSAEVVLTSTGGQVMPQHLKRLRQYLELAESALEADADEEAPE